MSQENHEGDDPEAVTVWVGLTDGESKQLAVRSQYDVIKGWVEERMGRGEWQETIAGKETYATETGEEGMVILAAIPDARALVVEHPAGVKR